MYDNVKDRIRMLLNLAQNNAASEGEINNALKHVRRLMAEHNIKEEDITPADKLSGPDNTVHKCFILYTENKNISSWENMLASFVQKLIGVVGCYIGNPQEQKTSFGTVKLDSDGEPIIRQSIVYYGSSSEARLAKDLYKEIYVTIVTMSKLRTGKTFRGAGKAYCEGFVIGLNSKIDVIKKEECTDIVLYRNNEIELRKQNEAREWLQKERNITLGKPKTIQLSNDRNSFTKGFQDGQKANISSRNPKRLT